MPSLIPNEMPNHIARELSNPKTGYTQTAVYFDAGVVRVTDSYCNVRHLSYDEWCDVVQEAKDHGFKATYAY